MIGWIITLLGVTWALIEALQFKAKLCPLPYFLIMVGLGLAMILEPVATREIWAGWSLFVMGALAFFGWIVIDAQKGGALR